MAGISSKAAGGVENKKGFNGNELQSKEFSDGLGLDVYDFNARTYDPQIGRFWQVDPELESGGQESWTPYHFGFNNPILQSDPDGRFPIIPVLVWAYRTYRVYRAVRTAQEIAKALERQPDRLVVTNMMITQDAKGNWVTIPESQSKAFAQQVRTEKINDLNEQAGELKGEIKSLEKSARSLEKNVKEHEQKIEDYRNDPDKYDNKGELQGVSPELRQQKIDGRIKALEKQVKKNQGELEKANKQLDQKKKELQNVNQEIKKVQGT